DVSKVISGEPGDGESRQVLSTREAESRGSNILHPTVDTPRAGEPVGEGPVVIPLDVLNSIAVNNPLHNAIHRVDVPRIAGSLRDDCDGLVSALGDLMGPTDEFLFLQKGQGQHHSIATDRPDHV